MKVATLAALVVLLSCAGARADFIQWQTADGGNGHYYGLVMPADPADGYSWTAANAAADSMTYLGSTGHLVTVTSAGENDFLATNFASQLFDNGVTGMGPHDSRYAWIGLFAPTPTSDFQWVTGESLNYTNWAPMEPNYFGTPLWQYVHYWTRDFGSGPTWTWNNDQNTGFNPTSNTYGYIVEFDGPFSTIPEPGSITLFICGGLSCCFFWTRRGRHSLHNVNQALRL